MSDYVYLYRGGERPTGSPEQMQQQVQKWMTWLKQLTEQGHIADPGHPLERAGKLVRGQSKEVIDGPFAEAKDVVGGYTLVRARDLAHAVELTAGCPILELTGGYVEVRPVMSIGQ